jgi:isocitrate dehydrogenase kinase/phosphatase
MREALAAAREIHAAFRDYFLKFVVLSRRAHERFARADWPGHQRDATRRLDLYADSLSKLHARLGRTLDGRLTDHGLWCEVKRVFEPLAATDPNPELERTFFNSVTRQIFSTVGVDPRIEFVQAEPQAPPAAGADPIIVRYEARDETADVILRILEDHRPEAPYRDAEADARLVGLRVDDLLMRGAGSPSLEAFEVLRPAFFRNKAAYLVGRIRTRSATIPLVLPLLHTPQGVAVDAVLTNTEDVSILFSFTRSYFHVATDRPRAVIAFLQSIMPNKPVAELYISLGLYKHGKTELYRSLERHLERSSDQFEIASGDEGLVMLVFTLPSYDRVFKLIRDSFLYPKQTTPEEVRQRYRLVFERDRVGRLVEAQQFEHLRFRRDRFSPALLAKLREAAARTVHEDGAWLTIEHLYTERRVRPLNLYLREVGPNEARLAVLDYGTAIKELAAANIFPGDFLLKNFGVTRHQRVVFYDYDELCLLSDCRFLKLPVARTPEDELAAEPWFTVAENDVFPEEFRRFLGLSPELAETLERHHGDLFTPEFWQGMQERHRAGEVVDFYPYSVNLRLRP